MQLTNQQIYDFREIVWDYYVRCGRNMPWRETPTPYFVLVSELMLQQTQVNRVIPKFEVFVERLPNIKRLAAAPLSEVLGLWSGLGYNRRAQFLHRTAHSVIRNFAGILPQSVEALMQLPGIGKNTAGAIAAYAFNQPTIFIETNIRSVYFHHFFTDREQVDDQEVRSLLVQTLDQEHPRVWYWALMDYGAHLKQTVGNNIVRSRHYVKQSKFEGSRRQLRGQIVRLLLNGPLTLEQLKIQLHDDRLVSVVQDLKTENLIIVSGHELQLQ